MLQSDQFILLWNIRIMVIFHALDEVQTVETKQIVATVCFQIDQH